jgi:hypothetical protein
MTTKLVSTVGEYAKALDENIADLVARLKAKQYKPQPVLRVYIPKPNRDKNRSKYHCQGQDCPDGVKEDSRSDL